MTCWGGKYLARRNGNWWERSVAIGKTVRETSQRPAVLLRRGRVLEGITLGWNVAGIVVLAVAAVAARSVALAGFGLDSLIEIEIGASAVVLWELSGRGRTGSGGRSG